MLTPVQHCRMTNLEREWRVGRQLALLTNPGEALPGFMGTGSGVVTKSGKFRGMSTAIRHASNLDGFAGSA